MSTETPVHITSLLLENVKRVMAFGIHPTKNGLTIIGGKNGQGKTTILDSIAWLLGGGRYAPTKPQRDGAASPPNLQLTLSNGLVVERKGKNSALTVTDPTGTRHGQAILDAMFDELALDLPKFLNASDKEKAQILLRIQGIGDQLAELDRQETALVHSRAAQYKVREAKVKYAEELPEYPDAPAEPVSVSELLKQHNTVLANNAENQRKRQQKAQLEANRDRVNGLIENAEAKIAALSAQLSTLRDEQQTILADIIVAEKSTSELVDASTADIEASIRDIEVINAHVNANLSKSAAAEQAQIEAAAYLDLDEKVKATRQARLNLLAGANLPLPELTVEGEMLLYKGQPWDGMSGAEQLRVAVAIVRCLNPKCGFVLMDKLEQFDPETLADFSQWLVEQNLQAIATRVSTGEECTIIIEDGLPKGKTYVETVMPIPAAAPEQADWAAGGWS